MPERNYQTPQIAQGRRTSMQASSAARQQRPAQAQAQPSVLTEALSGLLQLGEAAAKQQIDAEAETAYLEGVRQANSQASAEELETDTLTAAFTRGGYNMQNYRIEQAEFATEMQKYIKGEGKEATPEEFADKLRETSAGKFTEGLGNLSMQDRTRALAAQTELEQGLVQAHNKAHKEYSLFKGAQAFNVQGNRINTDLTQARESGDAEAYGTAANEAALFLNDILESDQIAYDMRGSVAKEYVKSLLSTDNADVVEKMRDEGMLDTLEPADRTEIDTAIRKSRSRTEVQDNYMRMAEHGDFLARIDAGEVQTYAEVNQFIEDNLDLLSGSEIKTLRQKFYKSTSDADTSYEVFKALHARDRGRLHQLGTNAEEAIMRWDQSLAEQGNYTMAERTLSSLKLGLATGSVPPQIGARIGSVVRAVSSADDEVTEEQAALLNGTLAVLDEMKARNPGAANNLLQAVPQSERALLSYAMQGPSVGRDPVDMLKLANENSAEWQAMQPHRRGEVSADMQKEIDKVVMKDMGLRRSFWWDASPESNQGAGAVQQWDTAVKSEMRRLAHDPERKHLFRADSESMEALAELASANVAQSSVIAAPEGTDRGAPVIFPSGINPTDHFEVDATDRSRIGPVLADLYQASTDETYIQYGFEGGTLYAKETDAWGAVLDKQVVDRKAVGEIIREEKREAMQTGEDATFGMQAGLLGMPVQDMLEQAGLPPVIEVDGNNTAGTPKLEAFDWRKRMLPEVLELPGESTEEVSQGFADATDAALNAAERLSSNLAVTAPEATEELATAAFKYTRDVGVVDPASATRLAVEAFKLGGTEGFGDVSEAIYNKDWEGFKQAAMQAPWYAEQTPEGIQQFIVGMQPHFEN